MYVHDNSCFNEIVLIDMPSGTTCPAVAAATILCDPLLSRILLQTHFNISIKQYSHLHVPDHHPLDSGIKCSLEMQDGSHAMGVFLIHCTTTMASIISTRGARSVVSGSSLGTTSNGCALSMCVCQQQQQVSGFNRVDAASASLITGKEDSLTCYLGQGLLERLDGRDLTLVVVYNTVAKTVNTRKPIETHSHLHIILLILTPSYYSWTWYHEGILGR